MGSRLRVWDALKGKKESTSPLGSTVALGAMNDPMVAAMRLTLASSALLVIYIDASEPIRYAAITYIALALYIAYGVALYVMTRRWGRFPLGAITHWIDVAWYVIFIGLSHSIFFFFFFFAILVTSFQRGFTSGLRVTLISAVLFTTIGLATVPVDPDFDLNLFLLQSISLVVLGYMMAHWGGAENMLKRRLALLKDISALSHPRFGIDRMLGSLIERLRTFYHADACLLVTVDPATGQYSIRRASRHNPEAAKRSEPITEDVARLLLELPATQAMVSTGKPRWRGWWRSDPGLFVCDVFTTERITEVPKIEQVFEAESLVTVPVLHHGETIGRLYVITSQRRVFEASDITFLLQVFEHTLPLIDNIRLMDRLASAAVEMEHQRIARDLHDSVIQPYIGLQMGLAAIRQKLMMGYVDIRDDIERVNELTNFGIAELRRYMGELKSGGEHASSLVPALQRFARKFTEATGIAVHIETASPIRVSDRLAAEILQMVAEGLSNVRRHTSSAWAVIRLACSSGHLVLRIENDCCVGMTLRPFTPRSLTERAVALGGKTWVECNAKERTVVVVDIPLEMETHGVY